LWKNTTQSQDKLQESTGENTYYYRSINKRQTNKQLSNDDDDNNNNNNNNNNNIITVLPTATITVGENEISYGLCKS
jgi:hypothetical protein